MKREDVEIGMRVVAVRPVDGFVHLIGKIGTVRRLGVGYYEVGVEFDEVFEGGHGNCGAPHRCRFGQAESFDPYFEDDKNTDVAFSFDALMRSSYGLE